ncbi:MAG TPA: hypothetical protein VMU34_12800 [Mycobacterium sp.]|nr:hypothetical protein [Mycobacterium sp.]
MTTVGGGGGGAQQPNGAVAESVPVRQVLPVGGNGAGGGDGQQPNGAVLEAGPALPVGGKGGGPAWQSYRSDLPQCWSLTAAWRQNVQGRRISLLDDLLRLNLTEQPSQEERAYLIGDLLADANAASTAKVNFKKWYWGTEVERAGARLREVEERTVDLVPENELLSRAADASAHGNYYLKADDKSLQQLEALRLQAAKTDPPQVPAGLRASIIAVLRSAHEETDRINQEARYLRNRLLIASGFSLLFGLMVLLAQLLLPGVQLLAFPGGWHGSATAYLVTVMLFGSVGALFTAIPAISKIPSDHSPFNLPLQQALLKIVFGALVAVIGLAILSTHAVGVGAPTTWAGVFLLAAVFGAGQQAVTQYVDQRASQILTAAAPSSKTTAS